MKFLITGGSGFIGSNIAIFLRNRFSTSEIYVLDNLKRRGSELNLSDFDDKNITFIHGDIRCPEDFESLPEVDYVIECSAEPSVLAGVNSSPKYLVNTNLAGTFNCLEYAKKVSAKIIFLSTSRIYPMRNLNSLDFSESSTRFSVSTITEQVSNEGVTELFSTSGVKSLYGASKFASELLIEEYNNTYHLDFIINRCGVVAGPRQMGKIDQGIVSLWVSKHLFGGELAYIGHNGKQVRDVLHVLDLCDLIFLQIINFDKVKNNVYNVGGGLQNSISLLELTEICQNVTGQKIKITNIKELRPNDLKWFVMNNSKIASLLDWKPKHTVLDIVKDVNSWMQFNEDKLKNIFLKR
jgi:CDP-paratose 2-epimerase